MIYLGINIKEHRIRKNLTQEQLAVDLGVTSQTISRWENGTTYPDIVMLPLIAEYFGITIDMLMGYVRECPTAEREAFFKEIQDMEINNRVQKIQDMLVQYPNDVYLQFCLAGYLYGYYKKDKDKATEKELYVLCNRIIQSDKPGIQCGAMRLLALLYAQTGDTQEAMKYVNELPSICCGREVLATQILHGLSFKDALQRILD